MELINRNKNTNKTRKEEEKVRKGRWYAIKGNDCITAHDSFSRKACHSRALRSESDFWKGENVVEEEIADLLQKNRKPAEGDPASVCPQKRGNVAIINKVGPC